MIFISYTKRLCEKIKINYLKNNFIHVLQFLNCKIYTIIFYLNLHTFNKKRLKIGVIYRLYLFI